MANSCSVPIISNPRSLDDLRPRKFWQVIANEPVTARLSHETRNISRSNLFFFHGPTGSGKTTLSHILAAGLSCKNPDADGSPCGNGCDYCRLARLDQLPHYHEWSGAELDGLWTWWMDNHNEVLNSDGGVFFLDEAQDLSEKKQKVFLKQFESARATVILATTHIDKINDALVSRFQPNVIELRRPTPDQATKALIAIGNSNGFEVSNQGAKFVVNYFGCDMRKCTNSAYAFSRQLPGKTLTEESFVSFLGLTPPATTPVKASGRTCAKL
jgi:DNA polymerase III gamma/tau subunit